MLKAWLKYCDFSSFRNLTGSATVRMCPVTCLQSLISRDEPIAEFALHSSRICFDMTKTANFPISLSAKEFWKSVNIWGSYGQEFSVLFFLTHGVWLKGSTGFLADKSTPNLSCSVLTRTFGTSNIRIFSLELCPELCTVSNVISTKSTSVKITVWIEYKLRSLTSKVLTTTQPSYRHNLITLQLPRSTRSSSLVTLAF